MSLKLRSITTGHLLLIGGANYTEGGALRCHKCSFAVNRYFWPDHLSISHINNLRLQISWASLSRCELPVLSELLDRYTTATDCLFDADMLVIPWLGLVPDATKLQSKMVSEEGAACYCCQCSWQSISDTEPPKALGDWAMGGVQAWPHGGSGEGGSNDGKLQWGLVK